LICSCTGFTWNGTTCGLTAVAHESYGNYNSSSNRQTLYIDTKNALCKKFWSKPFKDSFDQAVHAI